MIVDVQFFLDNGAWYVWAADAVLEPLKFMQEFLADIINILKWSHWLE